MAQFQRVNGDAGGVTNFDVNSYVNGSAVGTGVTINPQGPKFDYYAVDFGASLTNAAFQTGGPIESVNSTIQQLTTIATYEIQADQTVATVRCSKYATYPQNGTTAAALQTAIRALGTVGGYDLSGATVVATTFGG
jgi:hypothetical protein